MSAIILVIDQLTSAMLGPFGNTMIETTNLNRLAADSLLFDFAFANSTDLIDGYNTFWSNTALSAQLANLEGESVLITDEPKVAEHRAANFDRVIAIEQVEPSQPAHQSSETQLANFFAQATAWMSTEFEPGDLCWLHSRGLAGAWDAPYEMRQSFSADEDPPPPTFVDPPAEWFDPAALDPDQILGWQQAAAAQVLLIDQFLGVLLDVIDASPMSDTVFFALTSNRGCALGEHGLVGLGSQLYGESVQVPLFIRIPDLAKQRDRRSGRSGSLVQVNQLSELLAAWLATDSIAVEQILKKVDQVLPDKKSEYVMISSNEQESLQTHAWKLIRSKMGGVQLFAKPDDRWEVNDVSDRCPEIVEKMIRRLETQSASIPMEFPPELTMRDD